MIDVLQNRSRITLLPSCLDSVDRLLFFALNFQTHQGAALIVACGKETKDQNKIKRALEAKTCQNSG